ncbi:MAG: GAF domain-containing protein [Rhizonema sp. PD38]|nr:GAF domain-containing protein [Rhizonema sp. PD38]
MNPSRKPEVHLSVEPENLGHRIRNYIRQKPELPEILNTTVTELHSFLNTDRVKIYKFAPDGSGQVVTESIKENRLPSLLRLNFPADDIPPHARELFIKSRVRSCVNVDTQQIGQSSLYELENGDVRSDEVRYRAVDPCHVEYLMAMGVKSSIVVPIFHHENLWGLLVSHNSTPRSILEKELEVIQMVANELSMAIARDAFITQGREKAIREDIINKINTLLHSLPTIELQSALEETVAVLNGSGGRLYIRDKVSNVHNNNSITNSVDSRENSGNYFNVYTCGTQPVMPETARYPLMEQYCVWQEHYKSDKYEVWAISDIYKITELRNLQVAFRPTNIRSILIVPLQHRQQLVGYLSVFGNEIETDTLWAGQFDPDQRQLYPRQSFEIWQESKKAQTREWTINEIELAQQLGKQFASAIHEYKLNQQVHTLNTNLVLQPQEFIDLSPQGTDRQLILFEVIASIQQSIDFNSIFKTTIGKLRRALDADRVVIYRFNPNLEFAEGEIVSEDVSPDFISAFSVKIQDICFKEIYATQYRQGRIRAITDIHNAGLKDCYVQMLSQLEVKANLVIPLVKDKDLWGLLCIHQCAQTRNWKIAEIQFATLLGTLLSLAVQKTDLLAQVQAQEVDLQVVAAEKQILLEILTKVGPFVTG